MKCTVPPTNALFISSVMFGTCSFRNIRERTNWAWFGGEILTPSKRIPKRYRERIRLLAGTHSHVAGFTVGTERESASHQVCRHAAEHSEHTGTYRRLSGLCRPPQVIADAIADNTVDKMRAREASAQKLHKTNSEEGRFVRKGSVMGWRDKLTEAQLDLIEQYAGKTMARMGFPSWKTVVKASTEQTLTGTNVNGTIFFMIETASKVEPSNAVNATDQGSRAPFWAICCRSFGGCIQSYLHSKHFIWTGSTSFRLLATLYIGYVIIAMGKVCGHLPLRGPEPFQ